MYLRRVKKTITQEEAARLLACIANAFFMESDGESVGIDWFAEFSLADLIEMAYRVEQEHLHTYKAIGPKN